jgi:hypothetical protein
MRDSEKKVLVEQDPGDETILGDPVSAKEPEGEGGAGGKVSNLIDQTRSVLDSLDDVAEHTIYDDQEELEGLATEVGSALDILVKAYEDYHVERPSGVSSIGAMPMR